MKVAGKIGTRVCWKDVFIVQLILHKRQDIVDISASANESSTNRYCRAGIFVDFLLESTHRYSVGPAHMTGQSIGLQNSI